MANAVLDRLQQIEPWLDFITHYSSNVFHDSQIHHCREAIENFVKSEDYEYAAVLVTVLEEMVRHFDKNDADKSVDRWVETQQPGIRRKLAILRGHVVDTAWKIKVTILQPRRNDTGAMRI